MQIDVSKYFIYNDENWKVCVLSNTTDEVD